MWIRELSKFEIPNRKWKWFQCHWGVVSTHKSLCLSADGLVLFAIFHSSNNSHASWNNNNKKTYNDDDDDSMRTNHHRCLFSIIKHSNTIDTFFIPFNALHIEKWHRITWVSPRFRSLCVCARALRMLFRSQPNRIRSLHIPFYSVWLAAKLTM